MDFFKEYYYKTHRKFSNWNMLVPQICFVLYLCDAIDGYIDIETIISQALKTYPDTFLAVVDRKKTPDTYSIITALKEAKSSRWRYAKMNWNAEWKLTRHGIKFAKEVERKKFKKY